MRALAYEELKGSNGKEVRFRAPRYDARKLFSRSPPRVRLRTSTYQLKNISLGGVAILCKQTTPDLPEVGEIVPITIQQAGFSIFESKARVCRRDDTVFGSSLAFNFVNNFIEFEKLLSRNAQAQISGRADDNASSNHLVPKEYRLFCADVLSVLRSYRAAIEDNAELAKVASCGFDFNDCYDACEAKLLQQWRPLWRTGNDLIRSIENDRDALQATKHFSELVLTPEFRLGSIWDRSYAKPLGYPGDYEIMNSVYSGERRGNDTYSMLLHRLGLEVAECIKTRMELVRAQIATTVADKSTERSARILSLGSGPAREIELFLSNSRSFGGRADFTLIDQEPAALQYAFEKTHPYVLHSDGRTKLQCLHMSFTEILRGVNALENLPPQDLIYSLGLIDYLTDRRAAALMRRLYETLAPGGLLIIGNMNETPLSNLWPMECIADWTLHYRNQKEMLLWAEAISPAAAWTETDVTERVRLLFVRKH